MEEFEFRAVVKVEPVKVRVYQCTCAKCGKILDFYGKLDAQDDIVLKISPCDCVKYFD